MKNLFSPVHKRIELLALIAEAEGEVSPELAEQLSINDENIQERTLALLELRAQAQTQMMGADATIAQAQAFKDATQKSLNYVEAQLKSAAVRLGTIQAGTYKVSIKESTAVLVKFPDDVPAEYLRTVPQVNAYTLPDKVAIAKALKAGEVVPGAELERRENLLIK